MIPDVTPNGVFYLPPTGWLTSFYNPPKSFCNKVIGEKRKNINYCLKIFEANNKIESDLIFDFNKNENITVKEVQHV